MCAQAAAIGTGKLLEATLDALWRQWRAIGAAAAGRAVNTQVDPEVLCLASLALEAHEPRLWTVMADWLRHGAPLLSVQRFKNVASQFPDGRASLERPALAVMEGTRDIRWRSLLKGGVRRGKAPSLPTKQRSAGPTLDAPPALLLRLRAAFTVGVKADLLAFLLGQPSRATVATAAAALGYAKPTVFRALQDLLEAGFAQAADLPAAREYWLQGTAWFGLLGGPGAIARWGFWREILSYICTVVRWDEDLRRRPVSEYARGTSLHELAKRHEADLARAGVIERGVAFPRSPAREEWRTFHSALAERLIER